MIARELRVAIDALYAAFARYPLPATTHRSPLASITDDEVRELRARSLREIPGGALANYAWRAVTTWGDVDELRHFLPRILELFAVEPGWTDVEVVLGKLAYVGWHTWPLPERRAIEHFIEALW